MVKVFSRPSCAPCATLKYWLNKKGITFTEYDADENSIAIAPTTIVGDETIVGLNLRRLAELLT